MKMTYRSPDGRLAFEVEVATGKTPWRGPTMFEQWVKGLSPQPTEADRKLLAAAWNDGAQVALAKAALAIVAERKRLRAAREVAGPQGEKNVDHTQVILGHLMVKVAEIDV